MAKKKAREDKFVPEKRSEVSIRVRNEDRAVDDLLLTSYGSNHFAEYPSTSINASMMCKADGLRLASWCIDNLEPIFRDALLTGLIMQMSTDSDGKRKLRTALPGISNMPFPNYVYHGHGRYIAGDIVRLIPNTNVYSRPSRQSSVITNFHKGSAPMMVVLVARQERYIYGRTFYPYRPCYLVQYGSTLEESGFVFAKDMRIVTIFREARRRR